MCWNPIHDVVWDDPEDLDAADLATDTRNVLSSLTADELKTIKYLSAMVFDKASTEQDQELPVTADALRSDIEAAAEVEFWEAQLANAPR